jgi:hypothetical protein
MNRRAQVSGVPDRASGGNDGYSALFAGGFGKTECGCRTEKFCPFIIHLKDDIYIEEVLYASGT